MLEPLINEKQLSTLTGIPAKTWQHFRYVGKGPPFVKIGRSVRYRPSEVESWLATNKASSANSKL